MIVSVVYLLVRRLLGCLTVLTRHQASKDAELTGQPPPVPGPLRAVDRAYRNAIDTLARQAGLAA